MQTTVRPSDYYMPLLAMLSNDDKLDIIAKLSSTMHSSRLGGSPRPDIRTCFSGSWDNDKSSVQVAEELRASRYYDSDRIVEW